MTALALLLLQLASSTPTPTPTPAVTSTPVPSTARTLSDIARERRIAKEKAGGAPKAGKGGR